MDGLLLLGQRLPLYVALFFTFSVLRYSLDKHSWQILAQFQPYIERVQVLALALEPERYDRLQEVHPPLMEH